MLIPANKNPKYQILESESNLIHVLVKYRTHIPKEKRYDEREVVVKMNHPREFAQFKEYKGVLGSVGEEVIHDPKYVKPEVVKPEEKPDIIEIPEKPPVDKMRIYLGQAGRPVHPNLGNEKVIAKYNELRNDLLNGK